MVLNFPSPSTPSREERGGHFCSYWMRSSAVRKRAGLRSRLSPFDQLQRALRGAPLLLSFPIRSGHSTGRGKAGANEVGLDVDLPKPLERLGSARKRAGNGREISGRFTPHSRILIDHFCRSDIFRRSSLPEDRRLTARKLEIPRSRKLPVY